ncbi:XRE family transcriptional regulator [Streptomyces sp. MUM 203J]|uniref:helix-turn-helix domain-containing protein n=1 Tax=Streptomyces sp. MUM 203J TaxID=2791990 RepID=UPI001F035CF8|nr:XRE family transcriptional regulator [Streptomyces sp. MUM 203J]MCH0539296.1 XRE family transcriptional regulator [Streptomyces sp. MUM 203J]
MPRWKTLPEELDPQVREFAGQLRALVDRSGLSLAVLADRTGYSRTSWERYLNGRLLAPQGAVTALAEVTGTSPVHLLTLWELAERAWSRAEMRRDPTMEALRIEEARAALRARPDRGGPGPDRPSAPAASAVAPGPAPGRGGRMVVMFLAGALGALLVVAAAVLLTDLGGGGKGSAAGAPGTPSASASAPTVSTPSARTPSPSASAPRLPPGVGCFGAECAGRDPETMGCGSPYATTAASRTVGTARVEVRYSETCRSAWARVTGASPGDTVEVVVPGAPATSHERAVRAGRDHTYTLMVEAPDARGVQACATLQQGPRTCTPLS